MRNLKMGIKPRWWKPSYRFEAHSQIGRERYIKHFLRWCCYLFPSCLLALYSMDKQLNWFAQSCCVHYPQSWVEMLTLLLGVWVELCKHTSETHWLWSGLWRYCQCHWLFISLVVAVSRASRPFPYCYIWKIKFVLRNYLFWGMNIHKAKQYFNTFFGLFLDFRSGGGLMCVKWQSFIYCNIINGNQHCSITNTVNAFNIF